MMLTQRFSTKNILHCLALLSFAVLAISLWGVGFGTADDIQSNHFLEGSEFLTQWKEQFHRSASIGRVTHVFSSPLGYLVYAYGLDVMHVFRVLGLLSIGIAFYLLCHALFLSEFYAVVCLLIWLLAAPDIWTGHFTFVAFPFVIHFGFSLALAASALTVYDERNPIFSRSRWFLIFILSLSSSLLYEMNDPVLLLAWAFRLSNRFLKKNNSDRRLRNLLYAPELCGLILGLIVYLVFKSVFQTDIYHGSHPADFSAKQSIFAIGSWIKDLYIGQIWSHHFSIIRGVKNAAGGRLSFFVSHPLLIAFTSIIVTATGLVTLSSRSTRPASQAPLQTLSLIRIGIFGLFLAIAPLLPFSIASSYRDSDFPWNQGSFFSFGGLVITIVSLVLLYFDRIQRHPKTIQASKFILAVGTLAYLMATQINNAAIRDTRLLSYMRWDSGPALLRNVMKQAGVSDERNQVILAPTLWQTQIWAMFHPYPIMEPYWTTFFHRSGLHLRAVHSQITNQERVAYCADPHIQFSELKTSESFAPISMKFNFTPLDRNLFCRSGKQKALRQETTACKGHCQ